MKKQIYKILIAGEGGQGVQTIAKILTMALEKSGQHVSYIPQFGPEQRGTPSVAFIQFSEDPIRYPRFETADYFIVLRKRALPVALKFIGKETEVLFDSSTIARTLIQQTSNKVWGLPATKIASEKFNEKSFNLMILASFNENFLKYSHNALWSIIAETLKTKFAKSEELKKASKEAFDFAREQKLENKKYSRPDYDVTAGIIISKNTERLAVVIPKLCKGCGICIEKCPVKAISFSDTLGVYGTPTPIIDIEKCIACGNCFRFCPDSAIKVEKKK